jgi:plastocyanin
MDRRSFLATASVATLGFAGCGGAPEQGTETEPPTDRGTATTTAGTQTTTDDGAGGQANTIGMYTDETDYYFDPIGLFVESGTTVTWVNESGVHSATAYVPGTGGAEVRRIPEGAEGWDSGTISEAGGTFEHTFETAGTYDYFCTPHKTLEMVGRIVVDEPGAVTGNPPDGEVPAADAIVEQGSIGWAEFTQ